MIGDFQISGRSLFQKNYFWIFLVIFFWILVILDTICRVPLRRITYVEKNRVWAQGGPQEIEIISARVEISDISN